MKKIIGRFHTVMRIALALSLIWLILAWTNGGAGITDQFLAYIWPLLIGWPVFLLHSLYKRNKLPLYFSIAFILLVVIKIVYDDHYLSVRSLIHHFPWSLFDKYTWSDWWSTIIIGLLTIWGLAWIGLSLPENFKLSLKKFFSQPFPPPEDGNSQKFFSKKKIVTTLVLFFSLFMGKLGQIAYDEYHKKKSTQEITMRANPPVTVPAPTEIVPEGWTIFYPGGFFSPPSSSGISFLSPCTPQYSKVDALEKPSANVIQYDHYTCSANDLWIIYYWVSYEKGIKVDSKAPLAALEKQFKFRTKTLSPATIKKYKGQLLNATYETQKGSGAIKGIVLADRSEAWSVIINYPRNNSTAENAVQRIIDSIEITKIGELLKQ